MGCKTSKNLTRPEEEPYYKRQSAKEIGDIPELTDSGLSIELSSDNSREVADDDIPKLP